MRRFVSLALLAGALFAQEFRSTLTGRVTDPTGAGVPNAKVVVVKTDTNSRTEVVSGPDGAYTAPFLAPGPYSVAVEVPGFKKYVHSGIQIGTNVKIAEDIRLEVGTATDSVTVTADAPLLDIVSASSGQTVTSREVENIPLNGRAPLALARNAFGVVPKQKHLLGEVKPYDTSGGVDFALGGANSGSNEYLLDGVPNMSNASRQSAFSPSMDAVSEVKIDLFQSDAAYGDTNGGTVNIVTKSGTNEFHGSLYEFNQTSALAANPFFLNAAGQKQAITRQNQYGGTVGGPVLLPKLYNGRNRVFFFFAYEGFKDSSPGVTTTAVPTAAERQGDFSALLAAGNSFQLFDPGTAALSGTKVVRQPFAGNKIPGSRLNAIAQSYLQYFPQPNQPGKSDGENNFVAPNPSINNFASYIGRLDVNITDRNKLFFDFHTSSYQNSKADIFHNLSTGQFSGDDMSGALLDDVHMFTPTLVLDTRLGFTRTYSASTIKSVGFNPTTLGFPAYMAADSTLVAMPRIAFSDAFAGLSTSPGSISPFTTIQIFASLTKVAGSHSIKAGADLRREQVSSISPGYSAGTFTFGTNWMTANSAAAAPPFGASLASFLLGLPTSGEFDINTAFTNQNHYMAYFVQDDWRVKPNLTLNLGLRVEHESPVAERYNRTVVGFDPTVVNQVTKAAQAAYAAHPISLLSAGAFNPTGGLLFASPSHRSGYDTPTAFVSPRAGLSWSPSALHNTTVFRGGFGMFNNPVGAYLTGPTDGFSQANSFVATNNSYQTPFGTLSDPFPNNSILQPVGSALGVNTDLGKGIKFYNPNIKQTYSVRWSFDVQHQFGKDTMLQVGYIGNHQVHLTTSNNLGALPIQYLSRSATRDAAVTSALGAVVANPFAGLLPGTTMNGSTTSVASLLSPLPAFSGVTLQNIPNGYGRFHMLAVRLQKRFSGGLMMSVNYEHSRLLEAVTQLNPGEPRLEYGVPSADFPDHFVLTGSYDLPVGRGKRLLGGTPRAVDAVIGGWVLNSVYTWESGPALSFGNLIYLGGPLNLQPRNLTNAFDTTRFDTVNNDQPNSYNYRTFPPMFNNLRSDAANNVDLSALKNFHIGERFTLQYRFEAFNAFNRTQFSSPNLSPTSKAFGTISGQANTPRAIQMGLRLKF